MVLTTSPQASVRRIGAVVKRATGAAWVGDLRDSPGSACKSSLSARFEFWQHNTIRRHVGLSLLSRLLVRGRRDVEHCLRRKRAEPQQGRNGSLSFDEFRSISSDRRSAD